MLKKPSILLSSYNNLHGYYCSCPTSLANPSTSRGPDKPPKSHKRRILQRRRYGSRRLEESLDDETDDCLWPKLSSMHAVPTPYQILCMKRSDPYSKRRFYELAKVYHPDRKGYENYHTDLASLSGSVKMERYRMVVAAHEILSDPAKRSAYDVSGAGWNGRPEHGAPIYNWGQNNATRWSGFDRNDSPFRNATWEDWEKWYQRDKAKQEPMYFSNGSFLMLVIIAILAGGFGQSVRVGDYSNVFQRQVELVHDDASKALRRRQTDSTGFGNRDERLRRFLKSRDPNGFGATDLTQEEGRKAVLEREMCMSDVVQQSYS